MKTMNKVLAVSMIAMLAVPAAHAKIVAETMLSETAGHYSSTHTVQSEIDTKQATISDLSTIRSGAAAGATALQSVTANSGAGVVTNVSKSGTAITMTKAKVAEADLADAVVAKLNSGDSALQAADITTGSANGTIAVDGTDVAVKGLGSAAYTASTAYATSAQGTKADTALQSVTANSDAGVVTNVSKNGTAITMTKAKIANADVADNAAISVSKISGAEATANKSTSTSAVADSTGTNKDTKYPTVAGAKAIADAAVSGAAGNYATAAQGAKADTAVQSVTLASGTNNGTVKLTVDGTTTDNIAVKGLGSAAYTASTAYDAAGAASTAQANAKAYTDTEAAKKVNIAQGTDNKDKVMITDATNGNVTTTAFIHATGGSYTAGGDDNDKYIPSVELVENIALTAAGTPVQLNQGSSNANKAVITGNDGVVTTGQIATGMIANSAVTTDKINAKAVTATKIADSTITSTQLANNAVTTAKITDANVTKAKLASDVQTSLDKADSSVQSVSLASGTNNGTVKLTVNGTTTDNIAVKGLGSAAYKNVTNSYSATGTDPVTGTAVASALSGVTATANGAVQTDQTTTNKNKVMSTTSTGQVTASTLTGSNGVTASVADSGAVTVSGVSADASNKGVMKLYTSTGTNTDGTMTQSAIKTAVDTKQDKTTAVTHTASTAVGSATKPVYIKSDGTTAAITSYEGNAATATKAEQDASGNVITSTYATKTEVSNNYATKNMELNAIPATPSTEGVYVLTAKITGSGTSAATTYYWEDIGR